MIGRTHDLAAFTALSAIALTHPLPNITLATGLVAVFANLLGGIAPDIDQPTAPFWNNLPIGGALGRVFDRFLGGHRFISHSLLGVFLFGFACHGVLQVLTPSFPRLNMTIIWWSFMIGFFSHLIMDTITREGVPWLLPIPIKFGLPPVKEFRVQTDGFVEKFIIFPGLLLCNIYLYYTHYNILLELLHRHVK
ncbi:MAG TPA: metal-dependent hydrolase [Methylomirabilota bacterium]|nr:metal-dependent hydrolase [Methylomirabilota bacterium]